MSTTNPTASAPLEVFNADVPSSGAPPSNRPGVGHNSGGEREWLYERFMQHHEESIRLGRRSVEEAVEAGRALVEIRETFPPRSGFMEWYEKKGLPEATVQRYLLLGAYIRQDAEYEFVSDAVAAARDERDRIEKEAAEEKARKAREEVEKQRRIAAAASDEKARVDAEKAAEKADKAAKREEEKGRDAARKIKARATALAVSSECGGDAGNAGEAEGEEPRNDGSGKWHPARPSSNEWYSPAWIVDPARAALGGMIGLDPASCAQANETIRAARYFTADDDGLAHPWTGRVWLNPPYSGGDLIEWCRKLVAEVESGSVVEAVVLLPSHVETRALQIILARCDAVCFPSRRIQFERPDLPAMHPPAGSAVAYFGPNPERFRSAYADRGEVLPGRWAWRDAA